MKRELKVLEIPQASYKQLDVCLETNSLSYFDQVLLAHRAKIRIMEKQVCELPALLHQVDIRKASNSPLEVGDSKHFAQHHA